MQAVARPNGLGLLLIPRQHTPTVAVRVYVRAGSRYDAEHLLPDSDVPALGLAHLTEHLLFKGTRSHQKRDVFAAVERLGGTLEAGTSREYLVLTAIVPPDGMATAIGILAEVLTMPTLREGDFWSEKLVVLQEIRRAQDREERIFDLLAETLWLVHPLRHPVLGTLPGLQALDHETLLSFYRQRIVARNAVLVVCGAFDPVEAERCVASYWDAFQAGEEQLPHPVEEPALQSARTAHLERDLHQTALVLAVPTVAMGHPDRSALKVAERVLGMGASARLYQRLREQERLVYSVQTLAAHYEDAGFLAVRCACDPRSLHQVRTAILEEWDRLCQRGIDDGELRAAQDNYAGTLARRFETNRAVAGIHGIEALLHRVETFDDAIRRIRGVQPEDVVRVARTYLNQRHTVSVTIGRAA